MPVVIVHKDKGVYLGSCMGAGLWSLLDAGQLYAVTFSSEQDALDHIQLWDDPSKDSGAYSFVPVTPTARNRYATIQNLKNAGLEHMIGGMGCAVAL